MAPTTPYASGIDSWPQPSYTQSYYPEIGQQAQPEHTGYLDQGTSFVRAVTQETPTTIPGPSNGMYPFYFTTLRDIILTDHGQSHLATGGMIKAGHRRPRLTGAG